MTWIRSCIGFLALVSVAGCASQLQGDVDYDETVDFQRYRSFAFAPLPKDRETNPNWVRARDEIRHALVAKGLSQASSNPDLLIRYALGTRNKVRLSGASTQGILGGIWINLQDAKTGELLWHGWAAETWLESMDAGAEIRKAVDLLLAQFPPPA